MAFVLGIIVGLGLALALATFAYLIGFHNGVEAEERADRERRQRGGTDGTNEATT